MSTMNLSVSEESGSATKLPLLRQGRNSLVSPDNVNVTLTPREKAASWATAIRNNIAWSLENHSEVSEEDASHLKQELITVFINALQEDNRQSWIFLHEVLELVSPYKDYLQYTEKKKEFHHYLERILYHVDKNKERFFDLHITESLSKIFPEEVLLLNRRGPHPANAYGIKPQPPEKAVVSPRLPAVTLKLPDGTDPYCTHVPKNEERYYIRRMNIRDLSKSIGDVALELAARESIWSHCLGTTALALSTDIPDERLSHVELRTPTPVIESEPVMSARSSEKTPRPVEEPVPDLTGREAVKYFAACHHLGKIKSVHFNLIPSRHYKPYDLVSVAKNRINSEHYVFSTFGVLHVYPDQPNDSMTLAAWQREAVLWKAVSGIPFFKNYLIKKMFDRWRSNKLNVDFHRKLKMVESSLLQNVVPYGAALLQVSRLLKELITVQFLPCAMDKTYQLGEFENIINYKNIQADKLLERFYSYCKMVITVTAEESFKKLRFCEEQVRKKSYFSKDSLHLQKIKKAQREENLRIARSETSRLGNFVKLVDHLIVAHMFDMTKTQVINFINNVLNASNMPEREGLFKANLIFTKQDVLALSPSKEKFLRVLNSCLHGIPAVLCARAIRLDSSISEHEISEETDVTVQMNIAETKNASSHSLVEGQKSATVLSAQGSHSQAGEATETEDGDKEPVVVVSLTDDALSVPSLLRTVTPDKKKDDLGVATPDLVVMKTKDIVMAVEGEGFMGQYTPLSRGNLEQKLSLDAELQTVLSLHADMMKEALQEFDEYCEFNQWLSNIQQFCTKWNEKSLKEFKGAAAFTIEQQLTELRMWSERVRVFDKQFLSENGMFLIDCSVIHNQLLSRLDAIYLELITFVADEGKTLAMQFCEEMKVVLQNLKNKHTSVDTFAVFAKNYHMYKKNTLTYQKRIEYIKSLYEVVRMGYRQLTPEEEKLEESVWASWEAFLMQMQDATEFVNTQTPLMTHQLEDTYKKLEKEAYILSEQATSGIFLDPSENPLYIMKEMKAIREKFFSIKFQLQEASGWRLAICGEPYNVKFLNEMTTNMDVRQELWKYVDVTTHAIKDWKQMIFRKMNTRKALEKLLEWQSAAGQLKPHLPHADPVLTMWVNAMQDFKKELPLLHKLTHDAIKERHWKEIFLGMNEPYNRASEFTVGELLGYTLADYADLIQKVYLQAVNEFDVETKFNKIRKFWVGMQFKMAKHIPDSMYIKEPLKKPSSASLKRPSKLERYRQEKAAAVAGMSRGLDVASDDFYILIEVEDLKYLLQDSYISIMSITQSPYLGDFGEAVARLCSALEQVEEIVNLWYQCQKKWLYLLKIFEKPELYRKFSGQAFKFEYVHNKFKDWMRVVSNDSFVMSVVNKRRGDKGYRLLQGDNLRSLFLSLIKNQEEILKGLESFIEKSRTQFPRLYFLSSAEIVDMLGVSRNPQALVPYVRKCFPGIHNLGFSLPSELMGLNTALDFALNADKLHAVSMIGAMGEEVQLFSKLEAYPTATSWLKNLDSVMKNTMMGILQACVQARMEESSRQPILIFEELSNLNKDDAEVNELSKEIRHVYRHWLLRFPVQCVLVAEAIMWERQMTRIFERNDDVEFKNLKAGIDKKLEQYVTVLKEAMLSRSIPANMKDRLECLLSCLIIQAIHHRDVISELWQGNMLSENNFDWLKTLRHRMDIMNVLRAKTVTDMMPGSGSGFVSHPSNKRPSQVPVAKVESLENQEDEPPKLIKSRTTVSSDYMFSPCYVQHLGNSFYYDYEYLGPTPCLVITPLTERVFLSLTQAAKNFQCGTLIGPAGTGKSETVHELAKFLGRAVFTVTCSDSITLPMMLQFVTGMVQSGCWALFDSTDRLTSGLMSVTAQQLDYLQTAMRTLDLSSENQYKIRGQPRFDKKVGAGDKVIRRNSLTTLHPLPRAADSSPVLERQKTVPHGFNEKGLVTYFEDTWVAERDRRRRHSIEKEIEIKESEFYKSNRPPSLFYEHVKYRKKKTEDYKHLLQEPMYVHRIIGNVMFNGKLIQASANYGCFMTTSSSSSNAMRDIPENFRLLMRPCAMVLPDIQKILEVMLYIHSFKDAKSWAHKLSFFVKRLTTQLPRKEQNIIGLRHIKKIVTIASKKVKDDRFLHDITSQEESEDIEKWIPSTAELDPNIAQEHSVVFGIRTVLEPFMRDDAERHCFENILMDIFPETALAQQRSMYSPYSTKLVQAIKEQLKESRMEENSQLVNKIFQLYSSLEMKQPVVMTGIAGSGKSTVLFILARAINHLNDMLFSPDHSKDELTTDRGIVFTIKSQKLKDDDSDEEFLQGIDEDLKHQSSAGMKKLRNFMMMKTKLEETRGKANVTQYTAEFPKVDIVKLYPTAMDPKELLGCMDNGMWHGGLLTKIVQDSYFMSEANKTLIENQKMQANSKKSQSTLPSILLRWVIMDGELDSTWTEGIKSLLDDERKLCMANGERIIVRDSTAFIFETASLTSASPSSMTHYQLIYCGEDTVDWHSLFYHWKHKAKTTWALTTVSLKVIENLVEDVFSSTLKFIKSECCSALLTDVGIETAQANRVVTGVQEVTAFLKILSTLFNKHLLREEIQKKLNMDVVKESEKDSKNTRQIPSRLTGSSNIELLFPNYLSVIKGMFAFAYIWSFGGYLHDKYKEKFSKFAHDVLYRASHPIRLPAWEHVFDYYVDEFTGAFVKWGEKQLIKSVNGYIVTPDVERYNVLIDMLVAGGHPVLLSGAPGVGKTSLIENMVLPRYPSTSLHMSRGMTAGILQDTLVSHIMELKSKSLTAVAPGASTIPVAANQKHLFFIDDLNMAPTMGCYQPPLELVRQILSDGRCHDRHRQNVQNMSEAQFMASCTLPSSPGFGLGKACHVMSSRLTRRFINFTVFTPESKSLVTLFSRPLLSWLEEFPTYSVEHHFEFAQAMMEGLLELYQVVRDKLRATPAHAHYVFSLHDIAHVIQGILLMPPRFRLKKKKYKKKKIKKQELDKGNTLNCPSYFEPTKCQSDSKRSPPIMRVIAQLWCHECSRTFSDRLISTEDQDWFKQTLEDLAVKHLCSPRETDRPEMDPISEETFSPHNPPSPVKEVPPLTPPPGTPSDLEDDDDDVKNRSLDDDVKHTSLDDDVKHRSLDDDVKHTSLDDDVKHRSLDDDVKHTSLDDAEMSDVAADEQSISIVATSQTQSSSQEPDSSADSTNSRHSGTDKEEDTTADIDTEILVTPDTGTLDTEVTADSSDDTSTSSDTDTHTTCSDVPESLRKTTEQSSIFSKGPSKKYLKQDHRSSSTDLRSSSVEPDDANTGVSNTGGPGMKRQNTKRGVTFKAGLITDREYEAYYGPLLSIEELKGSEKITDFIFSKYFVTWHNEVLGLPAEKGYVDSSQEGLSEALKTCLSVYNNKTSQRLELVFFTEAVYHAARLSRVLALPGGHALLIGISYCTGRASLVRLSAYMAHCKLFEPKPQTYKKHNLSIVQEHIKRASHHAGVLGKATVLLIHEDLGLDCLQDVSALMAEGTSPGLYSEREIQDIVSQMMPGGVQTKRVDKIEQAIERYVKRIKQNLHVIVCLNYQGNSFSTDFHDLHEQICSFPNLVKCSMCIDFYLPWSYDTYARIARVWLEDTKSKIAIPWSATHMKEQITKASYAMAYIHCSAKMAIERQFCHQKEPLRFYTPLTFMEFVHLFKVISAFVVKKERENMTKYEGALCKIDEAFGSIAEYKRKVDDQGPRFKASMEKIHALVEEVEQRKQTYIEALEKCRCQEDKIFEIQEPLERLKKRAHTDFNLAPPGYEEAKTALSMLTTNDFEEVKSYREPPAVVKFIIFAICLLFDKPQNWEEGRKLLLKENFIEDLIFYDKEHIPLQKFKTLRNYTEDARFDPSKVISVSRAVYALCIWVRSIEGYSQINRDVQGHLFNLVELEERFIKAQAKLGKLRIEANRLKTDLESKIAQHKQAMKNAKAIEKQMLAIEKKMSRASNLMENMSMQHFLWRSELKKAKRHVKSAPGDAVITAACVCYHGPLDDKFRSDLLQDWLNRCRQGSFNAESFLDYEQYSVTARLEILIQPTHSRPASGLSEMSDSDSIHSGINFEPPVAPQVRTFKYIPAVYDSRKYYKSELKRQDTMESIVLNIEFDDSDDDEDQSVISTRSGYSLQDILSDFDELSSWRMNNLPTDLHSVQNGLLMRVSCFNRKHCWPLLIDPDNQAEVWVKALQNSQNLFSEKDLLAEGEEYIEGLPMEFIDDRSSCDMSGNVQDMEPPPSRGTALTFSDTFTEFTFNDSSTVCTESQTMQNSRDRMSSNSYETDDLRPVTSVTNSWETFSLQADQSIDHPDNNLWIIEADDPSLNSRLINAVVHGVTVLVTHLERKPLDPLFRGLLLKHFYVDKDGNKAVRVGGMIFKYHPNFCLYLSTTVPLFLKGDGLHSFPVHQLCCINMALSDEAIINRLLFETMKFERKEFEGQKRSNENDIILHRQQLAREHEAIREKTLNMDGPLLEDRTMLESLLACQSNVEKNRIILEETRYMGDHLEGKFAHYVPIMTQSTMLYNILKKMFVLHPCYYLPFYKFINIFISVLKSRDRGKGSLGAPQVRAKELADATMSAIFKHVSMMMFEQHYNLLLLLVSLELMKWSHKASSKEISFFISGFEKLGLDEQRLLDQKPTWMLDKAWIDCNILESLHHPFHGLCNSLINNNMQWKEYLKAPIALVNPVPGTTLQELSLFQKCLLWKFCCPHRMTELSKAMTAFELGSVEEPVNHYNIFDVYNCTDQFTPTAFILPTTPKQIEWEGTEGYPYVNPAHEVKRLAKEIGMEGKIRIMNFGVKSQLREVKQAIIDCMQCGHWLLLQNYHMAGDTDIEFFSILKDIIYHKWHVEDRQRENTMISEEGQSLIARSNPSLCSQDLKIHSMFRLWMTTRANGEQSIPGVLVQHGLKVTCEATANFKGTLQKSYRSVAFLMNNWKHTDQEFVRRFSRVMPIALFHSLLLQQSYYGKNAFITHHSWTLTDLAMSVELFKKLICRFNKPDTFKLCDLMAQSYLNHCLDPNDANIVRAIISQLAYYSVTDKEVKSGKGASALLEKLVNANKVHNSLQRVLDSIEDTSSRVFTLPEDAERKLVSDKSRIIFKDMVQVAGAPELLVNVLNPPTSATVPTENILPQLLLLIQDLPKLPQTSRDQINPFDVHLHYEVTGYKLLVQMVKSDLELLLCCSRGEVSLNRSMVDTLDAICQDRVPALWLINTFPSCSSLKVWLKSLPVRMTMLKSYLEQQTPTYNLSVFLRPDQFFDAVIQTYSRKHFVDPKSLRLDVEVLSQKVGAFASQTDGVFVTGLNINNASWDRSKSMLVEQLPNTGSLQDLPTLYLKPTTEEPIRSKVNIQTETLYEKVYDCPLYCSSEPEFHAHHHIVHTLCLPTVTDVQIWTQKRVFLSTTLPNV